MAIERGAKPVSEDVRAEVLGEERELGIATRRLVEEIAAVRYMLCNVLELALETRAVPDYVRMVEIYGSGCVRLVRILRKERRDQGQLEGFLREMIDEAVRQVNKEWGWV